MEISIVMGVYNNLKLTKNCYSFIRKKYENVPIIISSGGSNDGTKEWLEETSLKDENLIFNHVDSVISLSENYNIGIKLVKTEKLVLIHNDMVIGDGFLENLVKDLDENTLLCYTTVEPPIFVDDERVGKYILNCGDDFDDFDEEKFNIYLEYVKYYEKIESGGSFFMSGYKTLFESVGYFDSDTFNHFFCEDDDFLLRTKLKGYSIKTTNQSNVYHFISKTSRYSEEFQDKSEKIEKNSNRDFIRKWGINKNLFDLKYITDSIKLILNDNTYLYDLEPYFNFIITPNKDLNYIFNETQNSVFPIDLKFYNEKTKYEIYFDGKMDIELFRILINIRNFITYIKFDNNLTPFKFNNGNGTIIIKKNPE